MPLIGIAQINTATIIKSDFIEESYTNYDSLIISECIVYNNDKSFLTGTAFYIDYRSRYYFIKEAFDITKFVLKIMTFKDGLNYGISKIIDPVNGDITKQITSKATLPFFKKYLLSTQM